MDQLSSHQNEHFKQMQENSANKTAENIYAAPRASASQSDFYSQLTVEANRTQPKAFEPITPNKSLKSISSPDKSLQTPKRQSKLPSNNNTKLIIFLK